MAVPSSPATRKTARGDGDDDHATVSLVCPVCLSLAEDVAQLGHCCGAIFCYGCIAQTLRTHAVCPACRAAASLDKASRVPFLERASAATERGCSHAGRGCSFRGDRIAVRAHEHACSFEDPTVPLKQLLSHYRVLTAAAASSDGERLAAKRAILVHKETPDGPFPFNFGESQNGAIVRIPAGSKSVRLNASDKDGSRFTVAVEFEADCWRVFVEKERLRTGKWLPWTIVVRLLCLTATSASALSSDGWAPQDVTVSISFTKHEQGSKRANITWPAGTTAASFSSQEAVPKVVACVEYV